MDADNNDDAEVGAVNQNGAVNENHGLEPEDASEMVTGIRECSMVDVGSGANPERTVQPSAQNADRQTVVHVKTNGSSASDKAETKRSKELKPQKIQGKGKSEKPSLTKNTSQVSVKKTDNTTEMKGTSNGSLAANTRLKQSVVKTKSFNDRHASNSDLSKGTKNTPVVSNTRKDKLSKSEMTSSSSNMVPSEGNVEKLTLKPLQKGLVANSEGDSESVESASAGDAKSHTTGKLPSYGFSFKCHERAEKRKEFYTKLEERIHAQEIEKNNQQVKSKESQQAELRMLRKSLNFKATPMPNFYQEPPPKLELKKIPNTRPRSPKLGRKNSSSSEGHGNRSRPARLSLDEKPVSGYKPDHGPVSTQPKQRQRKSLPRLPSEKTRLSKTGPEPTPVPIPHLQEEVPLPESESVPVARLDDQEVQVSDSGLVPIAHVEDQSPLSDSEEALVNDETRLRLEHGQIPLEASPEG
ncbi:hypothetical protein RND81_10G151700 [Saponaria officinalis]|uniref:TPX2 C-terminal domain-containing protein n=1 Tax=Saponaria officinalis TaxID=3572 RepID=A0AAW1I2B8_SAPOF